MALRESQVRLYGGYVLGMAPPTILFTEIDNAKKQDRADQAALTRAAKYLVVHFCK